MFVPILAASLFEVLSQTFFGRNAFSDSTIFFKNWILTNFFLLDSGNKNMTKAFEPYSTTFNLVVDHNRRGYARQMDKKEPF